MPDMSPQEFLKNHDAQDQLFSFKFGQYMEKDGSFNQAASRWLSGRRIEDAGGAKDALGTDVPKYLARANAALAKQVPLSRLVDAAVKSGTDVSDDPLLPQYIEQHAIQEHNRRKAIEKDSVADSFDTIRQAIRGEFSGGQVPASFDNLRSIPQVQQAIESGVLTDKQINSIPGELNRYQSAVKVKTNQDIKNKLEGLADEEPLQFEAIQDFTTFPLSSKDIGYFQKLQRQKRASAEGDPQLAKAYAAVRPMLPDDFDNAKNAELRQQFKGALRAAVIERMGDTGKKLNEKEYEEVGKQLLKQTLSEGFWSKMTYGLIPTTNKVPWWQSSVDVPEKAGEAIKQYWQEQGWGEPTSEQIRTDYVRDRFNKDFGKPKK